MNIKKIIVVEDDEIDVLYIERLFSSKTDFELITFPNGKEALSFLKQQDDASGIVCLTDVNMPVMDGITLLKNIREHEVLKSLPVFILTVSSEDKVIEEAMSHNVNGYLLKPVSIEEFDTAISNLN